MVIFEATFSARAFGLPDEKEALTGLSKYLAYALFVYLGVRIVDIVVRGQLPALFSVLGMVFLAEVFVGIVLPLLILLRPEFRASKWWRFSAASLVIFGLVWNRFSATLFAMHRPGNGWYFPSVEELVVSVGIVSAIIFFYNIAVKLFPVLPAHEDHAKRDAANVGQVRKKQEEAV